MDRDEQDVWVIPEGPLCTITVVHIPVDNEDLFGEVESEHLFCGDGNVVEEAEAHVLFWLGVMSRRTHNGKCVAHHLVADCQGGRNDSATGGPGAGSRFATNVQRQGIVVRLAVANLCVRQD